MPKLRLNKSLAQAGLSSRRGADRLIADGHVTVNGVVTRDLATLADPEVDIVALRGTPLPQAERKVYLLLHKPGGYVTTVSDPRGRPTVSDLVRAVGARLYPVGRLDWDVEGVLLMTNDGDLTHRLLHPRYGLPRVYEAEVRGAVPPWRTARPRRRPWSSCVPWVPPRLSASRSPRAASTRSSATARPSGTRSTACGAWRSVPSRSATSRVAPTARSRRASSRRCGRRPGTELSGWPRGTSRTSRG